jgi:hypothetical protein
MAKYLVTYHGVASADMEKVKEAFGNWFAEVGGAVLDPGAPVHMVAQVGNGEAVNILGYVIIEAPDKDAAVKVLENHPFVSRYTLQLNELIVV